MPNDELPVNPNRRRFLKSILGIGGALEAEASVEARVKPATKKPLINMEEKFFWADLKNGNIGFPTGLMLPSGRPGSIMKLITAAALLEEGTLSANEIIECRGAYKPKLARDRIACPKAHGELRVEEALGLSCNVYFATLAERLRPGTFLAYARAFGLDKPVSEFKNFAFPETFRDDEIVSVCIGLNEAFKPDALQLLRVAALVGCNGEVPFLKDAQRIDLKGESFKLNLKNETFSRLKKGMRYALLKGTAECMDPEDRLKLAVKTGTVGHGKKFESWIIGFFPYDKPKYAFSLFAPVGVSHDSAVPLAARRLLSVEWP